MIAVAVTLWLFAWLWWSGIEVAADPERARVAWLAGAAVLAVAYARAGAGLSWPRRLARAAGWAVATSALAALAAVVVEPIVDWVGPFLSARAAEAGWLAPAARALGLAAIADEERLVVQDWSAVPAHALSLGQLGLGYAAAVLALVGLATLPRAARWLRALGWTALVLAAWLPLRFLVVTRLVEDLSWIAVHWLPATVALSFLPALWLVERFQPLGAPAGLGRAPGRARLGAAALVGTGAALVAFGWLAPPPGQPAAGRILIDDAHSDWEWLTLPFTRERYGRQTTYNYRSLADYLAHHYPRVDALVGGDLDDERLAEYEIVVLKTPTRPFLAAEKEALVRYVERGGGLLLVSDHTDLFGMSTFINPIGEPFGIEFLLDDTFTLGEGSPSEWSPPRLGAHPSVEAMPGMTFETSCTLRPHLGLWPTMVGRGLGSELLDYAHVNFFGDLEVDPEERWGVFVQAAAARRGDGRVLGFTDSTVLSNFSVFYRGKPELALGMMEYLNRDPAAIDALYRLALPIGVALLAAAVWLARGRAAPATAPGRALLVAVALAGWGGGALLATRANAAAVTLPEPHTALTEVAFDRQYSSYRLPTLLEENVPDPEDCFDALFVATQRLHLFPRVAEDLAGGLRDARVFVVLNPESAPPAAELERLYAWVAEGNTLLVMDALRGAHLMANRFLEPAELLFSAAFPGQDDVPTDTGFAIYGGRPVALAPLAEWPAGLSPDVDVPAPLVSVAEVGAGRVVAVLGSERLSFAALGPVFNDPTPKQLAAYELTYALFEDVAIPEGWPQTCTLLGTVGEREAEPVATAASP